VPEILAQLRANPRYLTEQGLRVLDANGQPVAPAPEELARAGAAFPWTLRQEPGPLNPLGRIKFLFPNAHDVYLHDTPARELFGREERLFSHGCIRVQDPLALAALLLEGSGQWSREALEAAVATGTLQSIPLARPVLVIVQYWTASADEQGALHFYRDVYGRDEDLLRALDDAR
jgi:murein L,D-transpeptidase YcbB/YkuD